MLRKLSERLAGSTKSVTSGELPHAGKELGETTAEESHADDDVGGFDATGMDIEQRQNKRRRSKGEETTVTTHSGSALVRRTVTKKVEGIQWPGVAKLGTFGSDGVMDIGSLNIRHFGRHFSGVCFVKNEGKWERVTGAESCTSERDGERWKKWWAQGMPLNTPWYAVVDGYRASRNPRSRQPVNAVDASNLLNWNAYLKLARPVTI